MFGKRESHRSKAERITGQAWEHLSSLVDAAGSTASDRAESASRRVRSVVDTTSDRVSASATEARRRAGAALDALAGRRARQPWGWLAISAAAGVVLGVIAAATARKVSGPPALPDAADDDLTDHA